MLSDDKLTELARVKWAARRGMLELDLVLLPYVESIYLSSTQKEKELFCKLLECEDQDLFNWFIKSKDVDKEFQDIVDKVLTSKINKSKQEYSSQFHKNNK